VRLDLPGGATTDLVAMSTDRFLVSTRSAFVAVSRAMRCRAPLRWVRMAWLTALRQVRAPVTFVLAFPPRSYARRHYYTINTFVWSTGGSQPVRYRWRPAEGPLRLWPWTRLFKHRRYLDRDLGSRMQRGPVVFALEVQRPSHDISAARLADAAKPLPRRCPWTSVGELRLDRVVTGAEADELDRMVFNPTHLVDGVELYPGDEIMAARAAAYSASHVVRAGDTR
jgi:catalase